MNIVGDVKEAGCVETEDGVVLEDDVGKVSTGADVEVMAAGVGDVDIADTMLPWLLEGEPSFKSEG